MARWLALLFVSALLLSCGASAWWVDRQIDMPFIALGASNVQIVRRGLSERLITYTLANPEDAWLSPIARRLSAGGWFLSLEDYRWGSTENYVPVYVRSSQFWCVRYEERAKLLGDKRAAQIFLTSRLMIECW